jgi:hypothetical protein
MADVYSVIVPLVIAKDESDRDVYIYEGFAVPGNVTDESVKRLLKEKFIAKVEAPVDDSIPEGDPTDKWTVAQLNGYAARESIDLGDAKTKPELLAAVTKK